MQSQNDALLKLADDFDELAAGLEELSVPLLKLAAEMQATINKLQAKHPELRKAHHQAIAVMAETEDLYRQQAQMLRSTPARAMAETCRRVAGVPMPLWFSSAGRSASP